MFAMTEVAGAYDGYAWITGIVRTGCGIILKRAPPNSPVFEIEQARVSVTFVDYFELHLKGDNATSILELHTATDLSKSFDCQ